MLFFVVTNNTDDANTHKTGRHVRRLSLFSTIFLQSGDYTHQNTDTATYKYNVLYTHQCHVTNWIQNNDMSNHHTCHKTLKQNKKRPPLLPLLSPFQSHWDLQIRPFYGLGLLSKTCNLLHHRFTTALLQMATVRNCLFLWAEQYRLHKTYTNFMLGSGEKHRFKTFVDLIKKIILWSPT